MNTWSGFTNTVPVVLFKQAFEACDASIVELQWNEGAL
jgi:hypothetical protein